MKTQIATGAATLILLAGMAAAQPLADTPALTDQDLAKMDTDGNGMVSRKEYLSFMDNAFRSLDKNKDGKLAASERPGALTDQQFTAMDTNGDGTVTRGEFNTQMMSDFNTADQSGDGELG